MNNLQPNVTLIRAIGSEFTRRKITALGLPVGIGLLIVDALAIWLTTLSVWWWLLAVPALVITMLAVIVYCIVRRLLKSFRPAMTSANNTAVKTFVDKLERVTDNVQTPAPIILFKIIRDIVQPHGNTFLSTVTRDGSTLHSDFLELHKRIM